MILEPCLPNLLCQRLILLLLATIVSMSRPKYYNAAVTCLLDSDDPSLNSKLCTFTITQKEYMEQLWYHCRTCKMVVCEICAEVCHKDHDLTYAKYSSFFCDCGAKEDGSCLALVKRTPASMSSPEGAATGTATVNKPMLQMEAGTTTATTSTTEVSDVGNMVSSLSELYEMAEQSDTSPDSDSELITSPDSDSEWSTVSDSDSELPLKDTDNNEITYISNRGNAAIIENTEATSGVVADPDQAEAQILVMPSQEDLNAGTEQIIIEQLLMDQWSRYDRSNRGYAAMIENTEATSGDVVDTDQAEGQISVMPSQEDLNAGTEQITRGQLISFQASAEETEDELVSRLSQLSLRDFYSEEP